MKLSSYRGRLARKRCGRDGRVTLFFVLLLVVALFPLAIADVKTTAPLSASHKKFLEDATWIISDYEKNAFLSLKTEEDRDRFINAFWENRDPTPGTQKNEFKDEHYARLDYAMKHFGRNTAMPGWKTDQGRIYILLGKPEFIKRSQNPFDEFPMELWHYVGGKGYGLPTSLYILFFQPNGTGPYRLYSPLENSMRDLFVQNLTNLKLSDEDMFDHLQRDVDPEIAHAALSMIPSEGGNPSLPTAQVSSEIVIAHIQNARNYDLPKRKYVEDVLKDHPSVKVYYTIAGEGIHDGIYWFQGPNGYNYLTYAIEYEPDKLDMGYYDNYYTSLTLDGQITTPDKIEIDKIAGSHEIKLNQAQFDQIKSLPFQYEGVKPIVPGKFGLTLIVTNNVSRVGTTFTKNINIPNSYKLTSPFITPILPIRVVQEAPQDGKVRPFQIENKLLIPNVQAKYAQKIPMEVYHQIIFPRDFSATNLQLAYIIRNGKETERELLEPLKNPASELAGNAVGIRKVIPLNSIALGSKQLVIEIRSDKTVLARSEPLDFTVGAQAPITAWRFAVGIPDYDSSFHSYTLGQQLLRMKRPQEALVLMQRSLEEHPESLDIRVQLMNTALQAKDYAKVLELGSEAEVKNPRNQQLLWLLGWAYYGQEKYEDAIRFFERLRIEDPNKVEVLNVLADTYYRLNQPQKSLERIQQSLALKPNQKDILEMKQKLEGSKQ